MIVIYPDGTSRALTDAESTALVMQSIIADADDINRIQGDYDATLLVDEDGNKYTEVITDGKLALRLVESADGTLNI